MYLKEIRAHGFKSFADKTNIELVNGINCIVGPNGSGKSNVVDAIRWVLGEQSVKELRGSENMSDVVFSGSSSRKAYNRASVTLTFDNSDKHLNTVFDEVSIKREYFKNGGNEYFINNTPCRLKDIRNLFLDSGSSLKSLNIISQGKISEILNSKPTDRREIFEEAAGVFKYKVRKEDALNKLKKTDLNITRINDILKEVTSNLEPLHDKALKAKSYLDLSNELKDLEIKTMVFEISKFNDEYQNEKIKILKINDEINKVSTNVVRDEVNVEELKNKILNLEIKYKDKNKELNNLVLEIEKLNSKKRIINERKSLEASDNTLYNKSILLKEEESNLSNLISNYKNEIEILKNEIDTKNILKIELEEKINTISSLKNNVNNDLSYNINEEIKMKYQISNCKDSIENNSLIPSYVKKVLNNPSIKTYKTLGEVISVDEIYAKCISYALGAGASNIIVDDEIMAKKAINYLKSESLGRATFLPINKISGKFIDSDTKNKLSNNDKVIDIAANLVKCDDKFKDIISNFLGNIIVVSNLNDANIISSLINKRYRVITLEGDIISSTGAITGGVVKTNNIIMEKRKLSELEKDLKNIENNIVKYETKLNEIDLESFSVINSFNDIKNNIIEVNHNIMVKEKQMNILLTKLEETSSFLKGILSKMDNNEDETINIINEITNLKNTKDLVSLSINQVNKELEENKKTLTEMESFVKKNNDIINDLNKKLKTSEINVSRLDVVLDNLINRLSDEYTMTFEKASELYILDMDVDIAIKQVKELRNSINKLGNVNIDSIKEYEELEERSQFLTKQSTDLLNAKDTLLDIIKELDKVMAHKFIETFNDILKEFETVFKTLFNGGSATLVLTDESNLLETGIDIVAKPPGKNLTNISLLSGGEKTLTAISLLFAIIKARNMPFCVLDEIEAALDDVNVVGFCKFLESIKNKTQFILITHKKTTMQYADVLYGITMQESGVSKLVSVKLSNYKDV